MMNSRSSQPADLPSPSAQPPCRSPWCHPGRLYAPFRDFDSNMLVTNERWSWRKEAGGWGGGSWRVAWLCLMSTHHLFMAFSNSARFEIRKLQTFQGIRVRFCCYHWTFCFFAKDPTICRKLHTWHHTHPTIDSFTSCIYLPWVPFKKTCWSRKPVANQMPSSKSCNFL